jgi:NitT/TauT family transport system ATP-binding protein
MTAQAKVEIDGISKVYDTGMLALENVSLRLADGSFTSLLGPSGCGKSTLLNMVAGFIAPTQGRIVVDGKPVAAPGADRGMVFQEYALFPWRTVTENVRFGPMVRKLPRAEQLALARKYLAMVGLERHAEKYPSQLSGGMKQRVAIARALANGPSVLLMDEPFGALDAQTRETLQEELLSIWQQDRKTVIFVTHSVTEAIFLSDQVVLMGTLPGSIREIFPVALEHPRDRTGAEFVAIERKVHRMMREEAKKVAEC